MKVRVLNAQAVRELLPYASCVDLMRKAMRLVAQGRARQPIRQMVAQTDGRGVLGWMPGYTDDPPWLGVKIVTVFPGNFGTAHGSHQGMVLLFETKNGAPKAIVEAREITAIRTAAATAVGTDVLARKTVKTLGLFGYGDQAHAHARAVPLVRKFDEILIWGRDFNRAHSFANELQGEVPCAIRAVKQAQEAAEADVVCTLTASTVPVFQTQWLKPGHHLNLVGSSVPTACEVEPELVRRARYFTDYPDSARVLAAEFCAPGSRAWWATNTCSAESATSSKARCRAARAIRTSRFSNRSAWSLKIWYPQILCCLKRSVATWGRSSSGDSARRWGANENTDSCGLGVAGCLVIDSRQTGKHHCNRRARAHGFSRQRCVEWPWQW